MAGVAAQPRYHVVTYVHHPGDAEADVLAQGEVQVPAAKGVDGDLVESVLSQVPNFQCDGHGHGTDGCKQNHAQAVERIRARLAKNDGTVAVVYRKYHPLIGQGEAKPGKPFEIEHEGVRVRVEVRQILDGEKEVLTDAAVSQVSLRKLQKDLAPKIQAAAHRMHVRSSFARFHDVQIEAAREQIAASKARFAELPDRAEVDKAVKAVEQAAQALVDEAGELLKQALANGGLNAQAARQFDAAIQQVEARLPAIFAPFQQIEQKAQRVLATQAALRVHLDGVKAALDRLEQAKEQHATLRFDKKPLTALRAELTALLEETKTKEGAARLSAITKEAARFAEPLAAQTRALERALAEAEAEARRFAVRVAAHQRWRQAPAEALAELELTLRSAGAFAAFPLAYWLEQAREVARKVRGLSDLSQLRYDQPGAEKTLAAAEKELAPVAELLRALNKELAPLVAAAYVPLEIPNAAAVAPTAWVGVEKVRKDKTCDVSLHLVHNEDRPMRLSILVGPEQKVWKQVVLSEKGQRLSFAMEKAESPLRFRLTALVPDDGPPALGGVAEMKKVDVPSAELHFANPGATHYNLPCNWTPASLKLGAAEKVPLELPADAVAGRQPILGRE